jgi:hypothetical protein
MVLVEILIDGVFMTALLTAVACLVYLVYTTALERHLLHTRRAPASANAARAVARSVSSPAAASPAATPDRWHRGPGSPAFPKGRG